MSYAAPLFALTRFRLRSLVLLASLVGLSACSEVPVAEPEVWQAPAQGWVETWRDDFEGPSDSAPDATRWNVEVHEHGFNGELDYDTNDRQNSFLDGAGNLVLQALKGPHVDAAGVVSEQPYTSARLNTHGKLDQAYGKFEARIKLPVGGKGVWPAFWLLGSNLEEVDWPSCGEVDILEWRGSVPSTITSSLHGPGYSGGNSYHRSFDLPGGSFADDFHTFTFEWTTEGARWLVDGNEFYVKTRKGILQVGGDWVYDHPFFVILNLAIGGIFDGPPDAATVFPQRMLIDYVSVSQLAPAAP